MNNIKIIAFTQYGKLGELNYNLVDLENFAQENAFDNNTPFLAIDDSSGISNIISEETKVLLVYDQYDLTLNEILKNRLNEDNIIIIKHNNMHISIKNALCNKGIEGMHNSQTPNSKPYKLIIDFLLSQRDAPAFTILKNALENDFLQSELKKKLQLLHDIYEGITKVEADSSIQEEVKDALIIFNKAITIPYDNTNEDHRKALIVLRDALLAEY